MKDTITVETLASVLGYTIDTYGLFNASEYMIDDDLSDDDWDQFNHTLYVKQLGEKLEWILSDEFKDDPVVRSVKLKATLSPREYNFRSDDAELDVEINYARLVKHLLDNKQNFAEHLKDRHSSRDGFWSYVSSDYSEFMDKLQAIDTSDRDWHLYAGSALAYYMEGILTQEEQIDYMYEYGMQPLHENIMASFESTEAGQ